MALIFSDPFPSEVSQDARELWRWLRAVWRRGQKFRAGQFAFPATAIGAGGVPVRVTFPATTPGLDNLVAGMAVSVTPDASLPATLVPEMAFVTAAGQLVVQVVDTTGAGGTIPAGTWAYLGYAF